MEHNNMGSVLKFLDNKCVLVTGAAGFLSKILTEKILRTEPNVKKLYLLVRAGDQKSANQRLQNEITGKDLFKVMKSKMGENFSSFIKEKVVMVAGDISCDELGIQDAKLKEEMWRELDAIVNLAATTNFDERYDVSLYLNTFGAKQVMDFANKCSNKLKVLVHVSTAYVSGERSGVISENPYHMGYTLNGRTGLNIEEERKLIVDKMKQLESEKATDDTIKLTMKDMGIERARLYGWPNVYVFTKALAEMLIMEEANNMKGNRDHPLPIVIIRPTIITSTFKEPFPGWVEGIRTIDSLAAGYGKGRITCFLGDPEAILDAIPGDMVVNATIVAMVAHANRPTNQPKIYQVGSSMRNPVRVSVMQQQAYNYFTKHPWINKDGKPVIVGEVKIHPTMASFNRYITLHYLLPLKGLQIANTAFCQYFKGTYTDLNRKISFVLRLIDIYRPYLFFKGIFNDVNTEQLRLEAKEGGAETDVFYFDPRAINWEDYFLHTHIPGLVKYVLK